MRLVPAVAAAACTAPPAFGKFPKGEHPCASQEPGAGEQMARSLDGMPWEVAEHNLNARRRAPRPPRPAVGSLPREQLIQTGSPS